MLGIQTHTVAGTCANKRNFNSRLPCGPFCQTNFQDRPLTNHSLSATTQPAASRISIGYLQLIPFAIRFRSIGHSFVLCLGAVSLIPVIYVSSIPRFLVTSSITFKKYSPLVARQNMFVAIHVVYRNALLFVEVAKRENKRKRVIFSSIYLFSSSKFVINDAAKHSSKRPVFIISGWIRY